MEEEIEHTFNVTDISEIEYEYTRPGYMYFHDAFLFTAFIIGMCCDILIIHAITRNKLMRSRTNIMILNLAITDLLFLVVSPSLLTKLLRLITDSMLPGMYYWITEATEGSFQLGSVLCIAAIASNTLIRSKKISNIIILSVIYGFIMVLVIINIIFSYLGLFIPILHLTSLLTFLLLLVVMVFKEVNNCCKCRNNPISPKTSFRLTIVRIYAYNWCFSWIAMILSFIYSFTENNPFIIFEFLYVSGYMSSLYITIHLALSDRNFKIYFLNLLRLGDRYNVDATISFTDNASDDEEQDAEAGGVKIDFGRNGKVDKRLRE